VLEYQGGEAGFAGRACGVAASGWGGSLDRDEMPELVRLTTGGECSRHSALAWKLAKSEPRFAGNDSLAPRMLSPPPTGQTRRRMSSVAAAAHRTKEKPNVSCS
jgi:hypothetical protein